MKWSSFARVLRRVLGRFQNAGKVLDDGEV